LSRAVAELCLGPTAEELPDCKRARQGTVSVHTGGYSQPRSALPLEAASHAADHLFEALVTSQEPGWNGRRAFLLDGTTATMGHHAELLEHFPPAVNQHGASHWPVMCLVVAHDLISGCATRPHWGPMYGPNAVSETDLAQDLLGRLGGPAMILADRNFGIFSLVHAAVSAGHEVVTRLTGTRFRSMVKRARALGAGQWSWEWRPSRCDRRGHPALPADAVVRGRLIEVTVEREGRSLVLWLFTTDLTATPEQLAELYRLRWRIETDLKSLKQGLLLDQLSGRSLAMVAKEVVLGVVGYNLVMHVRRLAAAQAGVSPRRLSFTRVSHLVEAFCAGVRATTTLEQCQARFERLLDAAGQCRLPVRKGFRSYPREVIPRRRGYPERKRKRSSEQKY
jgi:hypothetical protein